MCVQNCIFQVSSGECSNSRNLTMGFLFGEIERTVVYHCVKYLIVSQ